MSIYLLNSDARNIPLADQSVQCVVTSPPYWGLRDYGTATWQGGERIKVICPTCYGNVPDERGPGGWHCETCWGNGYLFEACDHKNGRFARGGLSSKQASNAGSGGDEATGVCAKCGAVRIDAQIGLERTPQEYVASIVAVMREVWRVLRDDGTV